MKHPPLFYVNIAICLIFAFLAGYVTNSKPEPFIVNFPQNIDVTVGDTLIVTSINTGYRNNYPIDTISFAWLH